MASALSIEVGRTQSRCRCISRGNSPSLAAAEALKTAVGIAANKTKPSDYNPESFTIAVRIWRDVADNNPGYGRHDPSFGGVGHQPGPVLRPVSPSVRPPRR